MMTTTIRLANDQDENGEHWHITWVCACNDTCPNCGKGSEPFKSGEQMDSKDILTSYTANKMIACISNQLRNQICRFLDLQTEVEFEEKVNLHRRNEIIEGVFKREEGYHLATTDNNSGEGLFYDLDDAEILPQDLVWIMEQIEQYEGR